MPRTKKTRIPPQSSSQPYGRTLVVAQRSPEQGKAPRPNRDVKKVPGIPRNRRRQQYGRTLVVAQRSPELGTVSCRDRRAMCVQVHVTNPIFSNDILSGVSDGHIMPAAFPNGGGGFSTHRASLLDAVWKTGYYFNQRCRNTLRKSDPIRKTRVWSSQCLCQGWRALPSSQKARAFALIWDFSQARKTVMLSAFPPKKHRRNYSVARFQAGFFFG